MKLPPPRGAAVLSPAALSGASVARAVGEAIRVATGAPVERSFRARANGFVSKQAFGGPTPGVGHPPVGVVGKR